MIITLPQDEDPEGDQQSPDTTKLTTAHQNGRNPEFMYTGSDTGSTALLQLASRQEQSDSSKGLRLTGLPITTSPGRVMIVVPVPDNQHLEASM